MKNCLVTEGLKKATFLLAVLFMSFAITPVSIFADEDVVFIGNVNIPADSLSSVDVNNIFLGKKTTWSNGNKITFVTLKEGETHKKFLRNYLKRNPNQFKNYWKRMLFTGKGVIPKSFETDQEVIDYVSENENVIGYISTAATADGIKTIAITQ